MRKTISFFLFIFVFHTQGFGSVWYKTKKIATGVRSTVFSKRIINVASAVVTACAIKKFLHPSLSTADLTCAGALGYSLAESFQSYFKERNHIKYYVDIYAQKALANPVPDCPAKLKITKKLNQHGYQVFFLNKYAETTHNAAVLVHGKKVIFFVCNNGKHTFFTDPELDAARDGIIEHEIAHVLNGDGAQRTVSRSFTKNLITAGFTCGFIKALTSDYTALTDYVSSVSELPGLTKTVNESIKSGISQISSYIAEGIPTAIQTSITKANAQAIALLPSQVQEGLTFVGEKIVKTVTAPDMGARVTACLGIKWLAEKNINWSSSLINAIVSRYHEKRADYAALKLNNPAALRGMANFFKKKNREVNHKKSWKRWWNDMLHNSHPCPCSRYRYLEEAAKKISKAQKHPAELAFDQYNEKIFI